MNFLTNEPRNRRSWFSQFGSSKSSSVIPANNGNEVKVTSYQVLNANSPINSCCLQTANGSTGAPNLGIGSNNNNAKNNDNNNGGSSGGSSLGSSRQSSGVCCPTGGSPTNGGAPTGGSGSGTSLWQRAASLRRSLGKSQQRKNKLRSSQNSKSSPTVGRSNSSSLELEPNSTDVPMIIKGSLICPSGSSSSSSSTTPPSSSSSCSNQIGTNLASSVTSKANLLTANNNLIESHGDEIYGFTTGVTNEAKLNFRRQAKSSTQISAQAGKPGLTTVCTTGASASVNCTITTTTASNSSSNNNCNNNNNNNNNNAFSTGVNKENLNCVTNAINNANSNNNSSNNSGNNHNCVESLHSALMGAETSPPENKTSIASNSGKNQSKSGQRRYVGGSNYTLGVGGIGGSSNSGSGGAYPERDEISNISRLKGLSVDLGSAKRSNSSSTGTNSSNSWTKADKEFSYFCNKRQTGSSLLAPQQQQQQQQLLQQATQHHEGDHHHAGKRESQETCDWRYYYYRNQYYPESVNSVDVRLSSNQRLSWSEAINNSQNSILSTSAKLAPPPPPPPQPPPPPPPPGATDTDDIDCIYENMRGLTAETSSQSHHCRKLTKDSGYESAASSANAWQGLANGGNLSGTTLSLLHSRSDSNESSVSTGGSLSPRLATTLGNRSYSYHYFDVWSIAKSTSNLPIQVESCKPSGGGGSLRRSSLTMSAKPGPSVLPAKSVPGNLDRVEPDSESESCSSSLTNLALAPKKSSSGLLCKCQGNLSGSVYDLLASKSGLDFAPVLKSSRKSGFSENPFVLRSNEYNERRHKTKRSCCNNESSKLLVCSDRFESNCSKTESCLEEDSPPPTPPVRDSSLSSSLWSKSYANECSSSGQESKQKSSWSNSFIGSSESKSSGGGLRSGHDGTCKHNQSRRYSFCHNNNNNNNNKNGNNQQHLHHNHHNHHHHHHYHQQQPKGKCTIFEGNCSSSSRNAGNLRPKTSGTVEQVSCLNSHGNSFLSENCYIDQLQRDYGNPENWSSTQSVVSAYTGLTSSSLNTSSDYYTASSGAMTSSPSLSSLNTATTATTASGPPMSLISHSGTNSGPIIGHNYATRHHCIVPSTCSSSSNSSASGIARSAKVQQPKRQESGSVVYYDSSKSSSSSSTVSGGSMSGVSVQGGPLITTTISGNNSNSSSSSSSNGNSRESPTSATPPPSSAARGGTPSPPPLPPISSLPVLPIANKSFGFSENSSACRNQCQQQQQQQQQQQPSSREDGSRSVEKQQQLIPSGDTLKAVSSLELKAIQKRAVLEYYFKQKKARKDLKTSEESKLDADADGRGAKDKRKEVREEEYKQEVVEEQQHLQKQQQQQQQQHQRQQYNNNHHHHQQKQEEDQPHHQEQHSDCLTKSLLNSPSQLSDTSPSGRIEEEDKVSSNKVQLLVSQPSEELSSVHYPTANNANNPSSAPSGAAGAASPTTTSTSSSNSSSGLPSPPLPPPPANTETEVTTDLPLPSPPLLGGHQYPTQQQQQQQHHHHQHNQQQQAAQQQQHHHQSSYSAPISISPSCSSALDSAMNSSEMHSVAVSLEEKLITNQSLDSLTIISTTRSTSRPEAINSSPLRLKSEIATQTTGSLQRGGGVAGGGVSVVGTGNQTGLGFGNSVDVTEALTVSLSNEMNNVSIEEKSSMIVNNTGCTSSNHTQTSCTLTGAHPSSNAPWSHRNLWPRYGLREGSPVLTESSNNGGLLETYIGSRSGSSSNSSSSCSSSSSSSSSESGSLEQDNQFGVKYYSSEVESSGGGSGQHQLSSSQLLEKDLLEKKAELVLRLSRKLDVLRMERVALNRDLEANESLGSQLLSKLKMSGISEPESEKIGVHCEEIEKVTRLLLSLSARLKLIETDIEDKTGLTRVQLDSTNLDNYPDIQCLMSKRCKLLAQLEEAVQLRESIDRRSDLILDKILRKYFTEENEKDISDFIEFIKLKSKLIVELKEVKDKIDFGEKQLQALSKF